MLVSYSPWWCHPNTILPRYWRRVFSSLLHGFWGDPRGVPVKQAKTGLLADVFPLAWLHPIRELQRPPANVTTPLDVSEA